MNMQTDKDDKELQSYLNGKSDLSELYAGSKDLKAPAHLNTQIERLAREAVEQENSHRGGMRSWKWPLAMAASFIIIVTATMTYVLQQQPVPDEQQVSQREPIQPAPEQTHESVEQEQPSEIAELAEPGVEQPPETSMPEASPPVQTAESDVTVAKQKPKATVQKQEFAKQEEQEAIPEHLRNLLQNTSASSDEHALPADEILKTWTREQWVEQVKTLRAQKRDKLAEEYIAAFPRFYPQEQLTDLLQTKQ